MDKQTYNIFMKLIPIYNMQVGLVGLQLRQYIRCLRGLVGARWSIGNNHPCVGDGRRCGRGHLQVGREIYGAIYI